MSGAGSPGAVSERLRQVGKLSDLATGARLGCKLGMSPSGVSARLRTVGRLTCACVRLAHRPGLPAVETWLPGLHDEISKRDIEAAALTRTVAAGTLAGSARSSVGSKIERLRGQSWELAEQLVSRLAKDARGLALVEAKYAIAVAALAPRLHCAWTPDLCTWTQELAEMRDSPFPVVLEGPADAPLASVAHQAFGLMSGACWTELWAGHPAPGTQVGAASLAAALRLGASRAPRAVLVSGFWEAPPEVQHRVMSHYTSDQLSPRGMLVVPAPPARPNAQLFRWCRYEASVPPGRRLLDAQVWYKGWVPPLGWTRT